VTLKCPQKYGYRPFSPTIDANEFSAIREELAAETAGDENNENENESSPF